MKFCLVLLVSDLELTGVFGYGTGSTASPWLDCKV